MKTLITGPAGHVGANLVRSLIAQGRQVRVLIYKDTRAIDSLDKQAGEVERVQGDVLDPEAVLKAASGMEVVYHTAAHISVDGDRRGLMRRINVSGTQNVARACLRTGVRRLVHFSSIHALAAEPKDQAINETRELALGKNVIAYDRTKALGETYIQKAYNEGLDVVVVSPTGILGPYDYKPSPMGQVLIDLCRGTLPGLVQGGFNWVDVRDVVQGAIAAEKYGKAGERYLLSGQWRSTENLANIVSQISGVARPRFVSPMWLAMAGAPWVTFWSRVQGKRPRYTLESLRVLQNHRLISHQKATTELGYKTRPIRQTVRDTIDWFRKANMLS